MTPLASKDFEQAAALISGWKKPVIISHAKPDGDALGSLAALSSMLRSSGTEPRVLLFDAVPDRYALFDSIPDLYTWQQNITADDLADADGVIVVDTCTYNQMEPVADWLRSSTLPKLAIDHHVTRDDLADHYLIDESAAAACLILYEWATQMNWPLDPDACRALFVGIAMDTGWFVHSNTDSRVLSAAAELSDRGVRPHELRQSLFQRESIPRIRLLGAALQAMEVCCDDKLAMIALSKAALASAGATQADTEDIINEPLRIGSVIASVLLIESDNGLVRASFRSKPPIGDDGVDVDVAGIANEFGGGGHKRAAGARIEGTLAEVSDRVKSRLEQQL